MEPITKAIILSGGVDLPLISEFENLHRALLPVANAPLIYYSISNLIHHGVKEVFITCDSKKEPVFREWLLPLRQKVRISYIPEPVPRGTAGTLFHVSEYISNESFWVLQGGLITDLDFSNIAKFHREQDRAVTIVTQRLNLPSEGICLDQNGQVEKIHLFHKSRERRRAYTPCGVYLINPKVLDYIDSRGYFDLKEQLIPVLHDQGLSVHIYEINGAGYVRQVRSLLDYYEANWDIVERGMTNGYAGDKKTGGDKVWVEEGTVIARSANLIGPVVIGKGVKIGENCSIIGPAVIGDHVIIENGSIFRESVALPRSIIPNESKVEYAIWSDKGEVCCFRKSSYPGNNNRNGNHDTESIIPGQRLSLYSVCKRFTDILFSVVGMILLIPLLLIIVIAIQLDSPGPIFYTQRRCGINGREFAMLKFRTMVNNADKLQKEFFRQKDVDGPVFKMKDDPRITRIGSFLRRTSLDEFPQLWNVLKGEMSLIGPRPLIMEEMRFNPLWRDIRLSVKPGITGLWQINGRGATSFHEWIQNDISYVMNQSFFIDMKILLLTIFKTLLRVGAH